MIRPIIIRILISVIGVVGIVSNGQSSESYLNLEQFTNTSFKSDGAFSLPKIQDFLDQMIQENQALLDKNPEQNAIEGLALDYQDFSIVKEKTLEELSIHREHLRKAYTSYLIPQVQELYSMVEHGEKSGSCENKAEQIYQAYLPLHYHDSTNNTSETPSQDYTFHKDDPNKPEAANLTLDHASSENFPKIRNCLGEMNLQLGDSFDSNQLEQLKNCQFDLSLLQPKKGPLWKRPSAEDRRQIYQLFNPSSEHFPSNGETLLLEKFNLSASSSAPLEALWNKQGQNIPVRIKLGEEIHAEITTSFLGQLLGFSQRPKVFREKINILIKNKLVTKYLEKILKRARASYTYTYNGQDDEVITVENALLEMVPTDEIPLVDFPSEYGDLFQKREYRSLLFWSTWLNTFDGRREDLKLILKKSGGGYHVVHQLLEPQYNMAFSAHHQAIQGNADQSAVTLQNPNLSLSAEKYSTATWYDLKWMTRNIAQLKREDFQMAIKFSGVSETVKGTLLKDLTMQRNKAIEAFGLENEYPLWELDATEPSRMDHVIDRLRSLTNPKTLVDLLGVLAGRQISFPDLSTQLQNSITNLLTGGVIGTDSIGVSPGFALTPFQSTTAPITAIKVLPGIAIVIGRSLGLNNNLFDSQSMVHASPFFVRDTLAIEVNLNSALFNSLTTFLPVNLRLQLKVYRKEFEHIHFANSAKEGYLSPFKLFKVITSPKSYAIYKLKPMEVIKVADSYGFQVKGGVSIGNFGNLISNDFGTPLAWRTTTPIYFVRDSDQVFHVYKEKTKEFVTGAYAYLLNTNLFVIQLPLLGFDFTYSRFHHKAVDYTFKLKDENGEKNHHDEEYKAVQELMNNDSDVEPLSSSIRQNFYLRATGFRKRFDLSLLFLFRQLYVNGQSLARISLPNGEERIFHRYFNSKENVLGFTISGSRFLEDVLTSGKKNSRVVVELDHDDPENFLGHIKILEYDPKMTRSEFDRYMSSLNDQYSGNEQAPLYVLNDQQADGPVKKILSITRIFINGKGLLEKVRNTTTQEMSKRAKSLFNQIIVRNRFRRRPLVHTLEKIDYKVKLSQFISAFKQLKVVTNSETPSQHKIVESAGNFLSKNFTDEIGIALMKDILSDGNIFVTGEIYGDNHLKISGKNWGQYQVVPPIHKFLTSLRISPPSIFINAEISYQDLLGERFDELGVLGILE